MKVNTETSVSAAEKSKSVRLGVRIITDGFPIDPSPRSLIPTAADRLITLKDNFIDSKN